MSSNSTCADPAILSCRRHGLPGRRRAVDEAGDEPVAQRGEADDLGRPLGVGGASASAAATMPATLWVPLRRSRSWPPPTISGSIAVPSRTTRTPTPFGPPNLWALSDSRSTCGHTSRRSSQHAAWTASVCSTAPAAPARARRPATAARSVIEPTSLLTAITLTTATSGPSASASASRSHAPGGVDRHDGAAVALDDVQHGVVLGGRAHGAAARRRSTPGDGGVVALGAAAGEHDLAGPAADDGGDAVAGLVDGPAGVAGEAVRAAGVGEPLGEERQHRLDRLRAHRRRRRMVEVHEPVHRRNANCGRTTAVEGYTRSSYGDAFADVYDDWYAGISDAEVTADVVAELAAGLAGDRPRRHGCSSSPSAPGGWPCRSPPGASTCTASTPARRCSTGCGAATPTGASRVVLGDMVDDLPDGPFDVVLVAYNSLFNLESAERQAACFAAVAARLAPGGMFVVEAFVPEDPPRVGTVVAVRSMSAGEVVLSISDHDPAAQRAEGHLVQFADGERVRLRPWSVRYAAPAELDAMAASAGLRAASTAGRTSSVTRSGTTARGTSACTP